MKNKWNVSMRIEKVDDIEVTEYTTGDIALVLRNWELKELKIVLEEWVESHSVVQGPWIFRPARITRLL